MMHYGRNLTGNERFFGFCVDILARVASEVGFEYILDLAPDKKYGAKDPNTGEWNGMVFQLMKHVSVARRIFPIFEFEIKYKISFTLLPITPSAP